MPEALDMGGAREPTVYPFRSKFHIRNSASAQPDGVRRTRRSSEKHRSHSRPLPRVLNARDDESDRSRREVELRFLAVGEPLTNAERKKMEKERERLLVCPVRGSFLRPIAANTPGWYCVPMLRKILFVTLTNCILQLFLQCFDVKL